MLKYYFLMYLLREIWSATVSSCSLKTCTEVTKCLYCRVFQTDPEQSICIVESRTQDLNHSSSFKYTFLSDMQDPSTIQSCTISKGSLVRWLTINRDQSDPASIVQKFNIELCDKGDSIGSENKTYLDVTANQCKNPIFTYDANNFPDESYYPDQVANCQTSLYSGNQNDSFTCKVCENYKQGNTCNTASAFPGCDWVRNSTPPACVKCESGFAKDHANVNCLEVDKITDCAGADCPVRDCNTTNCQVQHCHKFDQYHCMTCKDNFYLNRNYAQDYLFPQGGVNLELKQVPFNEQAEVNNFIGAHMIYDYQWRNTVMNQCKQLTDPIPNCYQYENANICKRCKKNYILDQLKTTCFNPFVRYINFCKIYKANQEKCDLCQENYYLSNDQLLCYSVTPVTNCVEYQENQCIKCINERKLVGNTCQTRITIANCKTYVIDEDLCEVCDNCSNCTASDCSGCVNYILTNNKDACIDENAINNCLEYDIDNELKPYCNQCKSSDGTATNPNSYTYKPTTKTCIPGTVLNCRVYGNSNVCKECLYVANDPLKQFYLDQEDGKCKSRKPTNNCQKLTITQNKSCDLCDTNHQRFFLGNLCQQKYNIEGCEIFELYNKCQKCIAGKSIKDRVNETEGSSLNSCESIPIPNCQDYDFQLQKCKICNEGFSLYNEGCTKINDRLFDYCEIKENAQLDFYNFKCLSCNQDKIPVDITNYYACSSSTNIPDTIDNCVKYGFREQDSKYFCVLCDQSSGQDKYKLLENNCVEDCKEVGQDEIINAEYSDYVWFKFELEKVEKDSTTDDKIYDKINIKNHHRCDSQNTLIKGCKTKAPNIMIQGKDFRKTQYICVECETDHLKVINVKEVSHYYTPNFLNKYNIAGSQLSHDAIQRRNLMVYPGYHCVHKNSGIVLKGSVDEQEIKNCDYYYQMNRVNSNNKIYGCLKCKYEYTGRVSQDLDTQMYFVEKCSIFDNTETTLAPFESKCEIVIDTGNGGISKMFGFKSGFTTKQAELEWNKVPLSTYLTCHQCSLRNNRPHVPVLVLHFEDISKFPTYTSYNPNGNFMTNFATPIKYNFYNNFDIPGRMNRCIRLDYLPSLFPFQNLDLNQYIFNNYQAKCSNYIINGLKYMYMLHTYKPPEQIVGEIIYCGACKEGYRPLFYPKILGQESNKPFMPYQISDCELIENCDINNALNKGWVNNCKQCKANYIYEWDDEIKQIRFDKCLSKTTTDKNCLAQDINNECKVCNKGFDFRRGICDQIKIFKCKDTQTLFIEDFPVNPDDLNLGRSLLFLREEAKGCNQCETSATMPLLSLEVHKSFFRNLRIQCVEQTSMTEADIENDFYEIEGCTNYKYIWHPSGELNHLKEPQEYNRCTKCDSTSGYVLNADGTCFGGSNSGGQTIDPNCQQGSINSSNNFVCTECITDYYFVNSVCTQGNINNCLEYDNNIYSTELLCSKCANTFYIQADKKECIAGQIQNCQEYENETTCNLCDDNYQPWRIQNQPDICKLIFANDNCKRTNNTHFNVSLYTCEECKPGYFIDVPLYTYADVINNNNNNYEHICREVPLIDNCVNISISNNVYDSTYLCTECNTTVTANHHTIDQYYLDLTTNKCIKRDNTDENAIIYNKFQDIIIHCQQGYNPSVNSDSCEQALLGIDGCEIYDTFVICEKCFADYYLKKTLSDSTTEGFEIYSYECIKHDQPTNNCKFFECVDQTLDCSGTNLKCVQCMKDFALNASDQCQSISLPNCVEYMKMGDCLTCENNFYLQPNTTVPTQRMCKSFANPPNCELADDTYQGQCLSCEPGYYLKDLYCQEVTTPIPDCLRYKDPNNCIQCNNDPADQFQFQLEIHDVSGTLQTLCKPKGTGFTTDHALAHSNCAQIIFYPKPRCTLCIDGRTLKGHNGEQNQCVKHYQTKKNIVSDQCEIPRYKYKDECSFCKSTGNFKHDGSKCN